MLSCKNGSKYDDRDPLGLKSGGIIVGAIFCSYIACLLPEVMRSSDGESISSIGG